MTAPERQPDAIGFALRDPYPWADLAGLVRAGEAAGYRALFLPEVGARDTLATLTGLAGETDRLLLGTGVVPLPARAPVAARDGGGDRPGAVRRAAPPRALGTGPAGPGALARLRDTVVALRRAFAGEPAAVDGAAVTTGLAPVRTAARSGSRPSDRARRGWRARSPTASSSTGARPTRVATAVGQIAQGADGAGRDPASVTLAVYVRAALAPGSAEAARAAAAEYASYPAYRRQFVELGIDPTDPGARGARRHGDGGFERA